MKHIVFAIAALAFCTAALADETVRGYTRRDGTVVAPYHRTEPNQYRHDNYSSQGNTNPYTGRQGTQPNEFSNPPVYNRSNPASGSNYSPPSYQQPSSPSPYGQQPRQRPQF